VPAGATPRKGRAGRQAAPLLGAPPADAEKGFWRREQQQETAMRTTSEDRDWNDDTVAKLRQLWDEGHSTAEIGRHLGVSKNAVVGKAHRLDLPSREPPIKRTGLGTPPPRPRRLSVPKLADIMPLQACTPAAAIRPDSMPTKGPAPERRTRSPVGRAPCCWPLGDPGTASFRFCGHMALIGKPYCEEHCRVAYTRARSVPAENRAADGP
jgi:GcrA cell cycle regulator